MQINQINHPDNLQMQGFSLIELMVVIVILGVLSSVGSSVMLKAKSKAKAVYCSSQLRQFSVATEIYRSDYNGSFFPYLSSVNARMRKYWFGVVGQGEEGERQLGLHDGHLSPYLGRRNLGLCPEFPYGKPYVKMKFKGRSYGYGYNVSLSPKTREGITQAVKINNPSQTVVFADSANLNNFQFPATRDSPLLEEFYLLAPRQRTLHVRHLSSALSVFVDGHIEPLKRPAWKSSMVNFKGNLLTELKSNYLAPIKFLSSSR